MPRRSFNDLNFLLVNLEPTLTPSFQHLCRAFTQDINYATFLSYIYRPHWTASQGRNCLVVSDILITTLFWRISQRCRPLGFESIRPMDARLMGRTSVIGWLIVCGMIRKTRLSQNNFYGLLTSIFAEAGDPLLLPATLR
jgi:hypothetical protein